MLPKTTAWLPTRMKGCAELPVATMALHCCNEAEFACEMAVEKMACSTEEISKREREREGSE